MIQLHVLLKDELKGTIIHDILGRIYVDEHVTVEAFLKRENKTWEDIDIKSIHYRSNKSIPYNCGEFKLHRGTSELEGYHLCFNYKPLQLYGKKPNK